MEEETQFDYEAYAKKMRLELSNPEIRLEDGMLNHRYFLAKKGQYWSENDEKALWRGLEIFGVGEWKDIRYFEFGNRKTELEIELRAQILLSLRNLKQYIGQKFTKEQILEEKQKNLELGKTSLKLQNGVFLNE